MDWKKSLFLGSEGADFISANADQAGIVKCNINDSQSYVFHQKYTKGAHLRKLADVKYHQIQWETPYYRKVLDHFLAGTDLKHKTILDFGCGDGRFTQYLLEKGATRIVCVDFDYATLHSLAQFSEENKATDKLLILHADFDNLPFSGQHFDLILSIGVLYYLNDQYEAAIRRFNSMLNQNGVLITSDPEIEGFFFRTLLFDGLEEAVGLFEKRRFKETKEKTGYEFRLFDKQEWTGIFTGSGFDVLGHKGISMFHNIIRVLLLRGVITEEQIEKKEQKIWEILDYFHEHGNLNKHTLWHLRRKG